MAVITPIERHGDLWLKRDDLFRAYGQLGGKARTCQTILEGRAPEVTTAITAGARSSPQVAIVANIARGLGLACRFHTPAGAPTPQIREAELAGGVRVAHKAGYNSVLVARAREDAAAPDCVEVPFGMECHEAVDATASQVEGLPAGVRRIVIPIGSGMSAVGVLHGLVRLGRDLPVLGVVVGANPTKRLDRYAPLFWALGLELVDAGVPYDHECNAEIDGVVLDPIYEAKCVPFLRPGDLLWVVGIRSLAHERQLVAG